MKNGVSYLSSKFGSITEAPDGLRFISCEKKKTPLFRAGTRVESKLLQYEVGRLSVPVQDAYGVEVEVYPYDPEQMTRVFFEVLMLRVGGYLPKEPRLWCCS
ncbi:BnaC01g43840D [Brassica napus]|uniref:BnaC01g43840D protein n=1 Tax=Brassica napus TaxID=3708 RepID=A0A078JIV6_BRANA|nr:BnaC01g43840D [Brassica napus]